MKLTNILTTGIFIVLATACGSSYDDYAYEEDYTYEEDYYGAAAYYEDLSEEEFAQREADAYRETALAYTQPINKPTRRFKRNGNVEMRPLVDTKTGQVTAYAPLPANWKLGEAWEGPGGTKVELRQGGSATAQQRPLRSIDQLIQQTFMPELQKANVQIDNVIDLPQIARNNEQNYARYWKAMPVQVSHQVKGIEMTDPNNGKKGMFIIHFTLSESQYGNMNAYYVNILEAQPQHYEAAKQTVIHALANTQLDDRAVAAFNQSEQQKSQASWAAHNQKMRANQDRFNSWQKTQQTLSEVNDIYYEGWKSRNAIQDAGHQKSINGIWEREAVVNPYSGQQGNVESGYKYYYMNQFGEYFGTNDAMYNPERDPNLNNQEWRKVQRPY